MKTDNSVEADRYLSDRGVLPGTAVIHQIEVVKFPAHEQLEKWLGTNGHKLDAAIVFPNLSRDVDGSIFPTGYSVRCFPPATRQDGTNAKFLATYGIDYRPYILPPVWNVASDTGAPLYIVEKQAAALLLWQAGLSVIALDGTWGAAAKRVDGEKVVLHEVLTRFDWIARPVYLCFDADFRNRQSVLQGLVRSYTLFSIAGAAVRVILWDQTLKGIDDFITNRAGLDLVRQREELDTLTATVSALSPKEAAEKWIVPQHRSLFEREIAAIQPGFAERSMLAEQIYDALGTTKADLKKSWGISSKEVPAPSSDIVDDTEPWPDPVNGAVVADKLVSLLKQHVYAPEEVIHAIVLWTFLCDMAEDASILPIAGITSPVKRCGKTNLLMCLARLCRKVLFASTISSAAVFRTIEECMPTLLIDEADTFLPQNEELRGVINAGHTKGSYAIRCNQETNKPEKFSTFCPKAIAMIGDMPETIADRAINIRLERKPRSVQLVPVRKAAVEEFADLARQKRRWVVDNVALICKAKPKVFALLNDRAAENWEILSQIAEVLGGEWPIRTTNASILLTPSDSDEHTDTIYLLVSLRKLFRDRGLDRHLKQRDVIPSIEMCVVLNDDKHAPWADWNKGFGITPTKLGRVLLDFGVDGSRVQVNKKRCRGYCWKDLEKVFKRYLDEEPPPDSPPFDDPPEPTQPGPGVPETTESENISSSLAENTPNPATSDLNTSKSNTYEWPGCENNPANGRVVNTTRPSISGLNSGTYPLSGRVEVVSAGIEPNLIPPSTPAAGFCVPTRPDRVVGLDLETFYPWPPESEITAPERRKRKAGKSHVLAVDSRRNGIRLLTVHTGSEIRVFDLFTDSVPDDIRDLLRNSTLVMHHADFDATVLRRHGFELSARIFDTMLASQLLSLGRTNPKRGAENDHAPDEDDFDPEEGFDACGEDRPADNDLASVVQRYLGVMMEKAKTNLGVSDWSVYPLSPEQLEYARADVAYFPALVDALTEALKSNKLWDCFRERSEFFVHLNDIKFAGVPVNRDLLLHDQQTCEGLKLERRAELKELFTDYRPPVPKSRRKKSKLVTADLAQGVVLNAEVETEEFNPNSPGQVVAALALHGIEVADTTKETLAATDSPETRTLLAYKEQMALFTMIKGIARSVFPDSRVRPAGWNQLAAKTGRIMSSRPNLQNLPRNWRAAFEAPDPFQWLRIDLAQIEMYIIALHCKDEKLISFLASGRDVYVEVAAEIFGKQPVRGIALEEVSDSLRSAAKTLTLGISYGMGPGTFIRRVEVATRPKGSVGVPGMVFEMEEAREFFARFFDMFPGIAAYHAEAKENAAVDECTYSITGQRRFLPLLIDDQDEYTGYWPSLEFRKRCIINSPIQGSAADMFVRAVNKFSPGLVPPVQVVNLVHDEIDLLVTEETKDSTVALVTTAFEESFTELFGSRLKVKLEHSVGRSWAK